MARQVFRLGRRLLVGTAVFAVSACGEGRFQKTFKVSGQVLLDGKPVPGVNVRFIPRDNARFVMAETPQGVTDTEGRFTLTTYYTGDGAPAGEYLVAIAFDNAPADGEENDTGPPKKGKQSRPRLPNL